ncbi:hypothetical protein NKH77_30070 [Streptomyces sp. M19]
MAHEDLAAGVFPPWPAADGGIADSVATGRRIAEGCTRSGDPVLRGISTATEARDLDRVRAALGSGSSRRGACRTGRTWAPSTPSCSRTAPTAGCSTAAATRTRSGSSAAGWRTTPPGSRTSFLISPRGPPTPPTPTASPTPPPRSARSSSTWPRVWTARPAVAWRQPGGTQRQRTAPDHAQQPLQPGRLPALARLIAAARDGSDLPEPQTRPDDVTLNSLAVSMATVCGDVAWPRSVAAHRRAVAGAAPATRSRRACR